MRISKRVPISVIVAAIAALSTALVFGALSALGSDHGEHGKGHGGQLIRESLAPSVPTDPAFHGVTAGGAPWVLNEGSVQLSSHRLGSARERAGDPGRAGERHTGTGHHHQRISLLRHGLGHDGRGHDRAGADQPRW